MLTRAAGKRKPSAAPDAEVVEKKAVVETTVPATTVDLEQFVKIMRRDMKHHGKQFRKGRNRDYMPFDPSPHCSYGGGIHFCRLKDAPRWFAIGSCIADVQLPPKRQLVDIPSLYKLKTDCIILSNIMPIRDHPMWRDSNMLAHIYWNAHAPHIYMNMPEDLKTPDVVVTLAKRNARVLRMLPANMESAYICTALITENPSFYMYVPPPIRSILHTSGNAMFDENSPGSLCRRFPYLEANRADPGF